MRQVWKHTVPVDDAWHMIEAGQMVAVGGEGIVDEVVFWAENDRPRERWFRVYGTGHDLPELARYVGTVRHDESGLVWHLYTAARNLDE